MLGALMSTLAARVTSFGLADLRGALHAGFDEGAWITTSFGVGQMLVGVASPYLGAIFGARRVLLLGIALFFACCLLLPLAGDLHAFLALLLLAGIGSGTFIPLTIAYVVRSLPVQLVAYGIALYAMNIELSLNIAASLEGWYADHWSWRWIYWQYCGVLPVMFAAVAWGMPKEPVNTGLLRGLDWWGLVYASLGFGMLYAGLDQGNRLDWRNSGLVVGLLLGGGMLAVAFLVRELTTPRPFLNLRLLLRGNLAILLLILAGFRFMILSTAIIIPTYLQAVQSFRELQVGQVLLWIALPQLLIVLPLGALLRRVDGRPVLALGSLLVAIACLMASELTTQWATGDFLPSQLLQALGQSFALTALVMLMVRSIVPAEALTIGALLQISRLFGAELGTAFMQTFLRVREQVHSNLVGLHVADGTAAVAERLGQYAARLGAHVADPALAQAQAAQLLAKAVAAQASVLAYADGFAATALGALACLALAALLRRGPPAPF
ncbi:MFS transporter [Paracraurococcus ruber]|uniref:MFS transporter n=2 Tax=Paracraurococcus ruber TaxID=77675 RepID=A0ABS1D4T3_9PROT|nr:MFS transporter [Paracraurococcus ruber]MBK1660874.1 MFS transporter [Paracraurococcus ruber]TDG25790.1 MFS transporter [Paracraurococcus ruber]